MRTLLVRTIAAAAFLTLVWLAWTQTQTPPQLTLNKVKDDLFEIEGDGGNVAVLVTGEGVVLIDDKFDQDHDQIVAKVKSVTAQPIKYIFSTHHHSDHSGGNAKFLPTVEIISTLNARNNILEHKQPNAADVAPARLAFTQEMSVFLGGKEVRARYYGRGHTNGDAVIYFPSLTHAAHGRPDGRHQSPDRLPGWRQPGEVDKTLDEALKLDFDTVIPGHGAVTNKAGLIAYRNNVEKLRNRVSGLIHAGKSQDEIAKVLTAEYQWAPNSLNMQWSLPGMMTELR